MTDSLAVEPVPTLKFAVPGAPATPPPLDLPPSQDLQIATGLASVAQTPESRQGIVCKSMLPDDQLAQAQTDARQLLQTFLNNNAALFTFGQSALEDVNALVDRLIQQVRPANVQQLKDIMTTATLNMKSIKGKYDLSSQDGRKAYDEWEHSWLKKLIHRGHNYIEAMTVDMQSVDTQLDRLEADLTARMQEIIRNIAYLDALYQENESAVFKLIYVIAVMEVIVDQAKDAASKIPDTEDTSPDGHKQKELKQALADVILQMNVKIGEYKGRLFVAWATSPQVRMMRVLNVGMAEKVNEAKGLTIPTMKLVIVQWRMQAESVEAAKAATNVSDATNEALKEFSQSAAAGAAIVMNAVETPTILPETVTAVTDAMVTMANNILTAVAAGDQKRAQLEQTIGQSKQVLNASQAKFDEQLVTEIVGASTEPVAIPASKPALQLPPSS